MAETWWSGRFVDVLESYGLGARMGRGRRYARRGQVLSLEVRPAVIAAQVQGSRRTPYLVTVSFPEPSPSQWRKIEAAMAAKIGFVARLLAGEVPVELEGVFDAVGIPLFPRSWHELRADCSCPDWENPCKHVAAVLYLFADQLDADPWLLLRWRGRTREQVLEPLHVPAPGGRAVGEIAPWWPFGSGPLPLPSDAPTPWNGPLLELDRPDAVLDQLEELDVTVAGSSFLDVIRAAYEALCGEGREEAVNPRSHARAGSIRARS